MQVESRLVGEEVMWVASSQVGEADKTRWQVGQRVNASVDGRQGMTRILVRKLFRVNKKKSLALPRENIQIFIKNVHRKTFFFFSITIKLNHSVTAQNLVFFRKYKKVTLKRSNSASRGNGNARQHLKWVALPVPLECGKCGG